MRVRCTPSPCPDGCGTGYTRPRTRCARARRQLRVFAAARIDAERLAAGERRHLVGVEAGRVDDRVGVDALARRDDGRAAAGARFDARRRRADEQRAVVPRRARPRARARSASASTQPVSGDQSAAAAATCGSRAAHERAIDRLERRAVRASPIAISRSSARVVARPARRSSLPHAHVRHVVLRGRTRYSRSRPFDAEPRLQRIRRIVQAGVNHAAVVRRRLLARPRVPLDHADRARRAARARAPTPVRRPRRR